jgi:N-acetylglutamate synthase-like GNAT family acetyltransferase
LSDEQCTVRFASLSDLDVLAQRGRISADIVRRKIEWSEFLVSERDGEIAGFLQLEYLWSSVPYIALIRVFPEHRRQGVGEGLLDRLEEFLRENGHKVLYSSSQADEPEPQNWHRRFDFKECGIIAGINEGVGEIFFCKRL